MEEKEEKYEQLGLGCSSLGRRVFAEFLAGKTSAFPPLELLFSLVLLKMGGSFLFGCRNTYSSSPSETKPRPACSPSADGQAFSPDFICMAAWKAAIQLAHEMGCSSSISARFFIRLITFDLDKIPLLPQKGQMTLRGSGSVPMDSLWLQAHTVHCTCPPSLTEERDVHQSSGDLAVPCSKGFLLSQPL